MSRKIPNYNSFNVSYNFEITSSYFHIFTTQNQTRNKYSTRQLWRWQFAPYSPSFYILSFHQTATHGTVIDALRTLESTSCIELEVKPKIQIFHLKLHWSKHVDNLSHFWKCFPSIIRLCRINIFPEPFSIIQSRSFARAWNTHFIIFSFRARDSFPEGIFWRQLAIHSPEYHNIMGTKCEH